MKLNTHRDVAFDSPTGDAIDMQDKGKNEPASSCKHFNPVLVTLQKPVDQPDGLGRRLVSTVWALWSMICDCRNEADWLGTSPERFDADRDKWRDESAPNALNAHEKLRLDKAEFDFATQLDGIRRIGLPLREIEGGNLFREKFGSFDEYCASRWGLDAQSVRELTQLMDLDDLRSLGNALLPCDHPRANELSDTEMEIRRKEQDLDDDDPAKLELRRYREKQGKYDPLY